MEGRLSRLHLEWPGHALGRGGCASHWSLVTCAPAFLPGHCPAHPGPPMPLDGRGQAASQEWWLPRPRWRLRPSLGFHCLIRVLLPAPRLLLRGGGSGPDLTGRAASQTSQCLCSDSPPLTEPFQVLVAETPPSYQGSLNSRKGSAIRPLWARGCRTGRCWDSHPRGSGPSGPAPEGGAHVSAPGLVQEGYRSEVLWTLGWESPQVSAQGPQPQRHRHLNLDSFLRWGVLCAAE